MESKKSLLPYRNSVKKTKTFKIDKNRAYNQYVDGIKPNGFWYEIEDCLFQWDEINWGKYIYEVKLDTSKILIIKNYNDYIKFHDKYGKIKNCYTDDYSTSIKSYSGTLKLLDWKKVSKDYSGFEVINFNSIEKKLHENWKKYKSASWLDAFDFSSGCIWNLKDLKVVKYVGEYELNSEEEEKYVKSPKRTKKTKSPKRTKKTKSPKRTKKTKSPKRTKKTKSPKRTKKNGF